MDILITGGAGFIGSNFVCYALKQGFKVINIDKLTYAGNLNNLEGYINHPKYHFYQQDICDRRGVENILFKHKPDAIIHMAAESHVDRSIDCPDEFIRTNINGTHAVLDVALKYYKQLKIKEKFRFIHLSTDEVFGSLGETGKFHEATPYKPNSPYAASKASSDLLVRSYFKTYGLPSIIVYSSNNYGPKQYSEKFIPLVILNSLEKKPLPIYGDGKQVRDWLFVEDLIQALFVILERGHIGEAYCVSSGNERNNLELVSNICSLLDKIQPSENSYADLITYVTDRPGHDFRYASDASKLKYHTQWYPKTSFENGLLHTIQWYVEEFEKLCNNSAARIRVGLGI